VSVPQLLPSPLRELLRHLRHSRRFAAQRRALRSLKTQSTRRIVIGSSGTAFAGWVSTDREIVDLLNEASWARFFSPDWLDAILAEHVWEHLSASEAVRAAQTCFRFLKPGGYLRVAVPDGLHPDPAYVEQVRPGGTGSGAEDHKVLYDFAMFRELFAAAGFDVRLREYFDREGRFQCDDWNPADGLIQRSMRFDERNSPGRLVYTSIILDAVKPRAAPGSPGRGATEV
jgi:predicted SAM-dependent methyltransferase